MNRDPILFRVDGTACSGWERLNRCLTFAAALQRRRRPTYFRSELDPPDLALPLKRAATEWLPAEGRTGTEEDLRETLKEIRRIRPAAIVVDSAQVNDSYLAELIATGLLVVSIDHEAAIRNPAQLVINPLLDPGRAEYDLVPGTQVLLGRRYALVRPEVRRVRPIRAQEAPQPFRALLALGEDHPAEKVAEMAEILLASSRVNRVDVLWRPSGQDETFVQRMVDVYPERVGIAREAAEVSARVARAHVAITAGGGWSLELACVGVPQIVTVHNRTYRGTAHKLEEEGAAICLSGDEANSPAALRNALQEVMSDPLERQAMARCGRKLIDGRGPDRLVTALEILLHSGTAVRQRQAA